MTCWPWLLSFVFSAVESASEVQISINLPERQTIETIRIMRLNFSLFLLNIYAQALNWICKLLLYCYSSISINIFRTSLYLDKLSFLGYSFNILFHQWLIWVDRTLLTGIHWLTWVCSCTVAKQEQVVLEMLVPLSRL